MASAVTSTVKEMAPERLTKWIRITNMVNAVLLVVSGIISLTLVSSCEGNCDTATTAVLSFYTILFGLLLLAFEARVNQTSGWILHNCGFMFSNRGKALFVLFLATLCFSVIDSDFGGLFWFPALVGGLTALNGIFVCIAIYMNPTFDEYSSAHAKEYQEHLNSGTASAGGVQASQTTQPRPHTHAQAAQPGGGYTFGDSSQTTADSFYQNSAPQPSSTPFGDNQSGQENFDGENPFAAV